MKRILFLVLLLSACDESFFYSSKGHHGVSASIAESKKRGTFIQEYCLLTNCNDSFGIKSVFVEKGFTYGETDEETKGLYKNGMGLGSCQFVVNFPLNAKADFQKYSFKLMYDSIESGGGLQYCSSFARIDSNAIVDTMYYYIFKRFDDKDTLGILKFVKVKAAD